MAVANCPERAIGIDELPRPPVGPQLDGNSWISPALTTDPVLGDRRRVSGLLSTSPLRDVEVRAAAVSLVTLPPWDVNHYGSAISVDAINTFRVSAARFASFHVVSRSQIRHFPVHTALWAWFDSRQLHRR